MRLHTNAKHQRANLQAVSFTPSLAFRFGILDSGLCDCGSKGPIGDSGNVGKVVCLKDLFFLRNVPVMLTLNPSESWD